jgi:hypothetical protein
VQHRSVPAIALLLVACAAPGLPPRVAPPELPYEAALRLQFTSGNRCSAVAIGPELALSARHCFRDEGADLGALRSLDGMVHPVRSVALSPTADIAVLSFDGDTPTAPVSPTLPRLLDPVWTVGFGCPPAGELGVRPAVWGPGPDLDGEYVLSGVVCPGDSGGPVFDRAGRVVALSVRRTVEGPPLAWVVPVGAAADALAP